MQTITIDVPDSIADQIRKNNLSLPKILESGLSSSLNPVRSIEDDASGVWMHGIAREWAEDLMDTRQDIYTLEDGQPIGATR